MQRLLERLIRLLERMRGPLEGFKNHWGAAETAEVAVKTARGVAETAGRL